MSKSNDITISQKTCEPPANITQPRLLSGYALRKTIEKAFPNILALELYEAVELLGPNRMFDQLSEYPINELPTAARGALINLASEIATRLMQRYSLEGDLSFFNSALSYCKMDSLTFGCFKEWIEPIALRLNRRPITKEKLDELYDNWSCCGLILERRIGLLIEDLLTDEQFLFLNHPQSKVILPVDHFTVAERLAYGLTDSPPDDLLQEAAQLNKLGDLIQIKPHVARLLSSPGAKRLLAGWVRYWLKLNHPVRPIPNEIFSSEEDISRYIENSIQEVTRMVEFYAFEGDGTLKDLFLTNKVFATDSGLAAIMGSDVWLPNNPPPLSKSGRIGILQRPGFLISPGVWGDAIYRGISLQEKFLCETFLPPSNFKPNEVIAFNGGDPTLSLREQNDKILKNQSCNSCHQSFQPVGYAFSNFDSFGRKFTDEIKLKPDGTKITYPISTQADNISIGQATNLTFKNSEEISRYLSDNSSVSACAAQRLIEFLQQRNVQNSDMCLKEKLQDKMTRSTLLDAFVSTILNEHLFQN